MRLCTLCQTPSKKPVEIHDSGTGEDGWCCRGCLRRYRRTTMTWPK